MCCCPGSVNESTPCGESKASARRAGRAGRLILNACSHASILLPGLAQRQSPRSPRARPSGGCRLSVNVQRDQTSLDRAALQGERTTLARAAAAVCGQSLKVCLGMLAKCAPPRRDCCSAARHPTRPDQAGILPRATIALAWTARQTPGPKAGPQDTRCVVHHGPSARRMRSVRSICLAPRIPQHKGRSALGAAQQATAVRAHTHVRGARAVSPLKRNRRRTKTIPARLAPRSPPPSRNHERQSCTATARLSTCVTRAYAQPICPPLLAAAPPPPSTQRPPNAPSAVPRCGTGQAVAGPTLAHSQAPAENEEKDSDRG